MRSYWQIAFMSYLKLQPFKQLLYRSAGHSRLRLRKKIKIRWHLIAKNSLFQLQRR